MAQSEPARAQSPKVATQVPRKPAANSYELSHWIGAQAQFGNLALQRFIKISSILAKHLLTQPGARRPAPKVPLATKPPAEGRKGAGDHRKKKEEGPPEQRPKGGAAAAARGKDVQRAAVTRIDDPEFQSAVVQVQSESVRQKKHPLQSKKRKEVEDAALLPPEEQIVQSSEEKRAQEMEQVGAKQQKEGQKFDATSFKNDFQALVDSQKPPKTESAVKEYSTKQPLEKFPAELSQGISKKQGEVTGPLEATYKEGPKGGTAVDPKEIPQATSPPPPAPIDPRLATAKPAPDEQLSQQHESDRLDGAMEQNRLSDDQLAESREPSFVETLKVKQAAKQKLAEAPGAYRQQEAALLQAAQAQTEQSLTTRLGGISGIARRTGSQVFGGQKKTESETEKRQAEIKKTIDAIYQATVNGVKATLEGMTTQVKEQFAASLKTQSDNFNKRVRARISDYYGDWRIDDKLFGPADVVVLDTGSTRPMTLQELMGRRAPDLETINPDVYDIFVDEKNAFIVEMGKELDRIADIVVAGLNAAQGIIEFGRLGIQLFKATLKGDELRYATQLEEEVGLKFENLEGTINDAREDLLQTLADQYKEQVTQLKKTFTDINDELKKSWIDRAIEFIETVGRTIFQLADLLLSILIRMKDLIWDIIKHPIRFFETLVAGLMDGIGEFIGHIGTYLQEAFWTWITGATPVKSIQLSAGSGVRQLFDLVLQVLSLGPAELRAIVEKVLGKEFMAAIDNGISFAEKALEPATILLTKGPVAFWDYLVDSLESVIESTFDRIKESVFFAFVEKGLKWIAGFFIPGGGFVKIVKAIVAAFQFVAANLDKIRQFFDAVFDSMEEAVAGNPSGVASRIVKGLVSGVVLALDFLARQLGLDKLVDSVQKILHSIRRPIVSAIEWVLQKVKPFVMKVMRRLGIGPKEQAQQDGLPVAFDNEIGKVVKFRGGSQTHRLFFRNVAGRPALRVASAEQDLLDFLRSPEVKDAFRADPSRYTAIVKPAIELAERTKRDADQVARLIERAKAPAPAAPSTVPVEEADNTVEREEEELANLLRQIFEALGPGTPVQAVLELRVRAERVIKTCRELIPNMTGRLKTRQHFVETIRNDVQAFKEDQLAVTEAGHSEFAGESDSKLARWEDDVKAWGELVPLFKSVDEVATESPKLLERVKANNQLFNQLERATGLVRDSVVLRDNWGRPKDFLATTGTIQQLLTDFGTLQDAASPEQMKLVRLERLQIEETRDDLRLVNGDDRNHLPHSVRTAIDALQETLSSQYRAAATRGEGSTAYMVYLERTYGAVQGNPPSWTLAAVSIPGTGGTLHLGKAREFVTAATTSLTELNNLLRGTTLERLLIRITEILVRERDKSNDAVQWDAAPSASTLPSWVLDYLVDDLLALSTAALTIDEGRLADLGLVAVATT